MDDLPVSPAAFESSAASPQEDGDRLAKPRKWPWGERPPRERGASGTRLPGGRAWLHYRAGGALDFSLVGLLMLSYVVRFHVWEAAWTDDKDINFTSVQVVVKLASLMIALGASFFFEGQVVVERLMNWRSFGNFIAAALLSIVAEWGYLKRGVSAMLLATLGYLYLPLAALMSVFAFPRRYGVLEWVSLAMITLGTIAFLLLRARIKWQSDQGDGPVQIGDYVVSVRDQTAYPYHYNPRGSWETACEITGDYADFAGQTCHVLASVVIGTLGYILAERVYKGRARCLGQNKAQYDSFYINMVHFNFASLVCILVLWAAPRSQGFGPWTGDQWFGPWTWRQPLMVFVDVGYCWLAGLVVKRFSTVCAAIAQTLSILLVGVLCDPMLNKYDFSSRAVPAMALAIVVLLSAFIFQTGRIHRRFFDSRFAKELTGGQSQNSEQSDERDTFDHCTSSPRSSPLAADRSGIVLGTPGPPEELAGASTCQQKADRFIAHCLTVVYVLLSAVSSLVTQATLSETPLVMGTFTIMIFVLGAGVASCMTLWNDGVRALGGACHPRRVFRFLPSGVLFAVSGATKFTAYALGVPASIVTVLGSVYTPISALGKHCVMGKVTMWLQWVALLITTLASMTFGFLQDLAPVGGSEPVSLLGLVCVIVSATLSAFGALFMEKFLKEEKDSFHAQKVSLDVSSMLTSLVLLPLSGAMSQRPKDAFWRERPLGDCLDAGCLGEVGSGRTCADEACSCECGAGVFVGWDSYVVWLTLIIMTAKVWFKGVVTKKTSVLEVAIAESFAPLLIYFMGEPLLFGTHLCDLALNAVIFIAPLSAVVFHASEHKQAMVMQHLRSNSPGFAETNSGDRQLLCPLEALLEELRKAATLELESPEGSDAEDGSEGSDNEDGSDESDTEDSSD